MADRELELVTCGYNNLNYTNLDDLSHRDDPTYLCLKNKTELYMGGSFYSDYFELLVIRILRCTNSSSSNITCASKEEQSKFFANNDI